MRWPSGGCAPGWPTSCGGFAGPLASGIQGFVRTEVGKIVQSQAFADAWVRANRVAHDGMVKALTGQGGGTVTVEGDTVSVNLAAFIQRSSSAWSTPGSAWPSGSRR